METAMNRPFCAIAATAAIAFTLASALNVASFVQADAAVAGAGRSGGGTPGGGNPGGGSNGGQNGDDSGALAFILAQERPCDLHERRIILPNGEIIVDMTGAEARLCEELMIRE
jgi:hypothetical protein